MSIHSAILIDTLAFLLKCLALKLLQKSKKGDWLMHHLLIRSLEQNIRSQIYVAVSITYTYVINQN